jgi:UDP-hydrolysing UDP-N-acetyl-D-glucosamine 2-epimerase
MKILGMTSIRSDYDLLSPLFTLLHNDPDIDFRVMVSGAHLSRAFGYTVSQIEQDGLIILGRLETLINGDSQAAKLKTSAILLQSAIDLVAGFAPDLILYSGDREDVIMYGLIGTFLTIPTVHFYGGDHEEAGHEDTVVRHATSKLSTCHFVAHASHQARLRAMGEADSRIFNVGAISLDRFAQHQPMPPAALAASLGVPLTDRAVLVIYHPSPSDEDDDVAVFEAILQVLQEQGYQAFVSYPNTDHNHDKIIGVINRYSGNTHSCHFFKNLERETFLSLFKHVRFLIGNSSAGIYEAASVPMPAINVGHRQTGRACGENVLFCSGDKAAITQAVATVTEDTFTQRIKQMRNMYGDGHSAQRAYDLIRQIDFKKMQHKTEDPLLTAGTV